MLKIGPAVSLVIEKDEECHKEIGDDTSSVSATELIEPGPPILKKAKRGHYRSYSVQFKMSIVMELYSGTPALVLSQCYNVPRTTILSWETQSRRQNKITSSKARCVHLCLGSRCALTYPKEVDKELVEWILCRRDSHLPVSTQLIKAKAKTLIKPHNEQFQASKGWLEKFMIWHSLSLRSRTSKLPPQLETKLRSFLNEICILKTQHC